MTRSIFTSSGHEILVDDEDHQALSAHKWHVIPSGYAVRKKEACGVVEAIWMHRVIAGLPKGDERIADHINGARLDNRRSNLRIATRAENQRNSKRPSTNKSGLKGASFDTRANKWRAQITARGVKKHLGYFASAGLAHEFYCLAADLLFGEFANHG